MFPSQFVLLKKTKTFSSLLSNIPLNERQQISKQLKQKISLLRKFKFQKNSKVSQEKIEDWFKFDRKTFSYFPFLRYLLKHFSEIFLYSTLNEIKHIKLNSENWKMLLKSWRERSAQNSYPQSFVGSFPFKWKSHKKEKHLKPAIIRTQKLKI